MNKSNIIREILNAEKDNINVAKSIRKLSDRLNNELFKDQVWKSIDKSEQTDEKHDDIANYKFESLVTSKGYKLLVNKNFQMNNKLVGEILDIIYEMTDENNDLHFIINYYEDKTDKPHDSKSDKVVGIDNVYDDIYKYINYNYTIVINK
jgi:hypothetical protein